MNEKKAFQSKVDQPLANRCLGPIEKVRTGPGAGSSHVGRGSQVHKFEQVYVGSP